MIDFWPTGIVRCASAALKQSTQRGIEVKDCPHLGQHSKFDSSPVLLQSCNLTKLVNVRIKGMNVRTVLHEGTVCSAHNMHIK